VADLLAELQRDLQTGKIEPWKGALLAAWLRTKAARSGKSPTFEDLATLLLDRNTATALEAEADGPWKILMAQARSIEVHRRVGRTLAAIYDSISGT
jgi:hypothetical protein